MIMPDLKSEIKSEKSSGFTLVELLITIAIVSILTAIAVPQYNSYRNKEIRSDAVRAILKYSVELERCRSRNGDGSYTSCPNISNTVLTPQQHYNITVALNTAKTSYTITATKVGNPDSDCGKLTITHDGLRDAATSNSSLNTPKKRIQRCWSS